MTFQLKVSAGRLTKQPGPWFFGVGRSSPRASPLEFHTRSNRGSAIRVMLISIEAGLSVSSVEMSLPPLPAGDHLPEAEGMVTRSEMANISELDMCRMWIKLKRIA